MSIDFQATGETPGQGLSRHVIPGPLIMNAQPLPSQTRKARVLVQKAALSCTEIIAASTHPLPSIRSRRRRRATPEGTTYPRLPLPQDQTSGARLIRLRVAPMFHHEAWGFVALGVDALGVRDRGDTQNGSANPVSGSARREPPRKDLALRSEPFRDFCLRAGKTSSSTFSLA